MSIIIKDLSYTHTDKEVLFSNLNLIINSGEKTALTGNNGCGKSTLMRILAGEASPGTGSVHCSGHLYYVPQHFGQYDDRTVAQLDYLRTRGIPSDIASREGVEVHYRMRGKWYFAVGFKNISMAMLSFRW